MDWGLCNVEVAFGSGRFITVVLVVMNAVFVTPLAVDPLTAVVTEDSVDSRVVSKGSLLVAPLADISTVDFSATFGDDVVFDVGTDVFVAEVDDNTGVAVSLTASSKLLQRLDRRRQSMVP